MKAIILGALAIIPAFSVFSEELLEKYSIQVLAEGTEGTTPSQGQEINMHYEGTLRDGTKFDSSFDRGQPLDFNIGVGQVIKCWDEVGLNMEVGAKVKVLCPSETAYGSRAVGPIAANSDLFFVMERVK
jgi:FKBP-type peptidyl-prolyl cis-trans isomerase